MAKTLEMTFKATNGKDVLFSISEDWQAEYCEGKFHN